MKTKTDARAELIRLYDLMETLGEDAYQLERALIYVRTESLRDILINQVRELRGWRDEIPPLLQKLHADCPDFWGNEDADEQANLDEEYGNPA